MIATGLNPVSTDCVVSSHIMDNLWPQSQLWLLASVCSCGESWHSSPAGQSTISLHCKECNTICNDFTIDNSNQREKQLMTSHFFFSKWSWGKKSLFANCPPVKCFCVAFVYQTIRVINCRRPIKCQKYASLFGCKYIIHGKFTW